MSTLPVLTVICPIYNEENAIPLFFDRVSRVFDRLAGDFVSNLLFVDNCSQDGTPKIVRELCEKHSNVYSIVLSRNFGYQCSVECGLTNARGDLFVVIDVDCEDPPELIPEFLENRKAGYDIVYGERLDRPENSLIKTLRRLFYRLTRSVADDYFVLDMAEFSLITAEVRDAIVRDNNSFPFIRSSIGRVGFRRKNIPYKREKRVAGKTHYNLSGMTIFAIAGILSSSTFLLRVPAFFFPIWAILITATTLVAFFAGPPWYLPGILVVCLLGFGFCGFTVVCISIYLARVYKNGLHRPNFIIRKTESKLQAGSVLGS